MVQTVLNVYQAPSIVLHHNNELSSDHKMTYDIKVGLPSGSTLSRSHIIRFTSWYADTLVSVNCTFYRFQLIKPNALCLEQGKTRVLSQDTVWRFTIIEYKFYVPDTVIKPRQGFLAITVCVRPCVCVCVCLFLLTT